MTSSLELQQQVLDLLAQLVQLRVNYCLLDSDQVFIGFVIKQFEYIEEGQIRLVQFSVLAQYHHSLREAAVVWWINHLPCKPGIVGLTLGFFSLSDVTKPWACLHMT